MSRADEEEPIISKQQQHLYLILDDWAYGYSFRKLDLSSHAPALIPEGIERGAATSLPPPFFCLEAQPGWPMYFTASGSKIWGMPPKEEGTIHDSGGVCYDVHAENFSFVPRHTDQPRPVYFPIGNKLFSLGRLSLQSLDIGTKEHPIGVALSWSNLINVPVDSINVISHAVFPDGRTIFVSTGFMAVPYTYSFHLSEDGSLNMWNPQGDWILPFHGSGYFDRKLNTWIGLSLYQEKPGHICSCDLTSATSQHPPVVKYTKDHLFTMDPDERHVGANLVYMGHRSKFCLVECIINNSYEEPRNSEEENTDQEDTDDYMLRLTTFSLDYDGNGDLMTGRRRVQYYQMPKHVSRRACQHPAAFWM